jgi:hypothetical protein
MAKFKFNDSPIPHWIIRQKGGKQFKLNIKKIRVHCSDGSAHEYVPQDKLAFKAGEEIDVGTLCKDPNCRCLRAMRADPRFQEVK